MSPRIQITLDKILDQAIAICDTSGYNALKLGAIASALGIKTPSLYNHIENLADLKQKLAIKGLEDLYNQVIHAAVGKSDHDALMSVANAYVNYARHNPTLYQAISKVPEPFETTFNTKSDALVGVFVKLFKGFTLEDTTRIHAVRGLRSLLHGFVSIELDEGFRLDHAVDNSLAFSVNAYLNGVKLR